VTSLTGPRRSRRHHAKERHQRRDLAICDAHPASDPLPGSPVIRRHAPAATSAGCRAGEGGPSSRRHPHGCASRLFAASIAFTPIQRARHSLHPPSRTRFLTTPQASHHAADRIVAPPYRACDAGLRCGPFPDQAASLLPGSLAITRTGLSPASGDELTDTKIHHGVMSWSPPILQGAQKATLTSGIRLYRPFIAGEFTPFG